MVKSDRRAVIVTEAMRLFAEHGYARTTITAIETASGLSPGSGALYRHFESKEAILNAGVRDHLSRVVEIGTAEYPTASPETLRPFLRFLGEFMLAELDAARAVSLVYLRESTAITEHQEALHLEWTERPYATATEWLTRQAAAAGVTLSVDAEAVAYLGLSPLLHFRLVEWATGRRPQQLTDRRLVEQWSAQQEQVVRALLGWR